jgi:uncharacterized protein YciI
VTSPSHVLLRLVPPRPSFPADMTEAAAAAMAEHSANWHRLMAGGRVVASGPVAGPTGARGLAVLEVGSRDEAEAIAAGDPAIASGTPARFEIHPVPGAVVRPHPA